MSSNNQLLLVTTSNCKYLLVISHAITTTGYPDPVVSRFSTLRGPRDRNARDPHVVRGGVPLPWVVLPTVLFTLRRALG